MKNQVIINGHVIGEYDTAELAEKALDDQLDHKIHGHTINPEATALIIFAQGHCRIYKVSFIWEEANVRKKIWQAVA